MSVTTSLAPASFTWTAREEATLPKPCIATVRPSRESEPQVASAQARMAWYTPNPVTLAGLPLPPTSSERPTTCLVSRDIHSMSWALAPTSSVVT